MPINVRNWSSLCAGVLALQIFILGSLPYELFEPWDKIFHVLAYAALTLLLWIATDGRRPMLVTGAVMALGFADEARQAFIPARGADVLDFLAGALAAAAAGAVLYWKTGEKKTCAESSRP
jgi:VanZ family protein